MLGKLRDDFHRWVKLRDAGLPCVSCNRDMSGLTARAVHASHFRPAGQNGAVRFHPWNVHLACGVCNEHLSGNLVPYRVELIERIGEPAVEWLESQTQTHTWDVEDLAWMREGYRAAIRRLVAEREV